MRRLTLSKKLHSSVSRGRPWQTDNPYTCSLRSVFPDAHAVGETLRNLIRTCGRELCKALQSEPPGLSRAAVLSPPHQICRAVRTRKMMNRWAG